MKLAPTSVGAEPKKIALLVGILVLGVVVYWFENRTPGDTVSASVSPATVTTSPASSAATAATRPPAISQTADSPSPVLQRRYPGGGSLTSDSDMGDFHPTLKVKEDVNLSKVDPRIQLDLLAKVRAVPMEGGSSSLFEFGKPPAPPPPKVDKINPAPVPVPPPTTVSKLDKGKPPKAAEPPPAPVPFRYYGYAGKSADGQLQEGFFQEGDRATGDVYPVREGQTLQNRYKIVRIGVRSAVVEDTVSHHQQTLPLLEEQQ